MKCLLQGQRLYTISALPVIVLLLVSCAALLAGCDRPGSSTQDLTTVDNGQQTVPTMAGTPVLKAGPQPCPVAVSTPAYWDSMVPIQPGINTVESVTCAYLRGNSSLQALVTVRYPHAGQTLDVHIYDDITSPTPDALFQLTGLYNGDARISAYGTLMTSEVNLPTSTGQTPATLATTATRNIQREFQWSENVQTFIPVAFPGLYPASTRYQAEALQRLASREHNSWLFNARLVAAYFVSQSTFLNWPSNNQVIVLQGGKATDSSAQIKVANTFTHATILLTMSRLDGLGERGIWIITRAQSPGLTLNNPPGLSSIRKPLTVNVSNVDRRYTTTMIALLDSNHHPLGAKSIAPGNTTTFTSTVAYTPVYRRGVTEGLLLISTINSADGSTIAIALFKTLL